MNSKQKWQESPSHRAESKRVSRARKVGAAIVAAVSLTGLGSSLDQMHDSHAKNVAQEAAEKATETDNAKALDITMYFKDGVALRSEPKIVDDKSNGSSNKISEVKKGDLLKVSQPVVVRNDDGEQFYAVTLEDGQIGYISRDVESQVDADGSPYTFSEPDLTTKEGDAITIMLPEVLGPVAFNGENFFANDHPVSLGQTMSHEDFVDQAGR